MIWRTNTDRGKKINSRSSSEMQSSIIYSLNLYENIEYSSLNYPLNGVYEDNT